MTDPLSTAASVATLAQTAAQTGKALRSIRFRNSFRNIFGHVKIAVFGYSGSGKSSFLSMLRDGVPYTGSTTRSTKIVTVTLPNGRKVDFYDCPGQDSYREQRTEIKHRIFDGKFHAVINVVCYGYNETDASAYKVLDSNGVVKPKYLIDMRKRELNQLDEWQNDIRSGCKLKWMMTLINKADIWWEDRREAHHYYSDAKTPYGTRINEISRVIPNVHTIEYCSTISRFGGGDSMLIHFDEKDKIMMHNRLLEQIQNFIENA